MNPNQTTLTNETPTQVGLLGYYPEMGEAKPIAQIEASISHYGGWFLCTPLTLKGRGIKHLQTYTAAQLTEKGQRKVGWNQYKVTDLAFEKLEKQYAISTEILL